MAEATFDIDSIFDATVEALLRSTTDIETEQTLIEDFGPDDLSDEARKELREEIESFLEENAEDLQAALDSGTGYSEGHIGQDIALTRNHHGAGFWDRGLGAVGTRLTDAAHNLGAFSCLRGLGMEPGGLWWLWRPQRRLQALLVSTGAPGQVITGKRGRDQPLRRRSRSQSTSLRMYSDRVMPIRSAARRMASHSSSSQRIWRGDPFGGRPGGLPLAMTLLSLVG